MPTLFDRLCLVVFATLFIWQVCVPLIRGKPIFPFVRRLFRNRRGKKS